MKSKLPRICAVVVLLALAAYIGLDFLLGSIVRQGVNRFGPPLVGTRVELAGARISPLSGSGTLTGLFVGNPAGWHSDRAFYLGRIHVEVSPLSLLGDHIVVKDVTIEGPEFVYETRLVSSNIGDLLRGIEGTAAGGQATGAKTRGGRPVRYEIRHFLLRGGKVTLGVGPAAVTLPMLPIELGNIGTSEGGITSDQIAVAVMRSMASGVVEATTRAAGRIVPTMGAAARAGIGNLFGGKSR